MISIWVREWPGSLPSLSGMESVIYNGVRSVPMCFCVCVDCVLYIYAVIFQITCLFVFLYLTRLLQYSWCFLAMFEGLGHLQKSYFNTMFFREVQLLSLRSSFEGNVIYNFAGGRHSNNFSRL